MKGSKYLIGSLFLLIISCSPRYESLAMIGKDKKSIKSVFMNDDLQTPNEGVEVFQSSDTLLIMSTMNELPYEALYLFENNVCYFQKLNIYCSPCADKAVAQIMEDKNYQFQPLDPINFISKIDSNVVMRLKEKLNDKGNCNEITIHKIGNKKIN